MTEATPPDKGIAKVAVQEAAAGMRSYVAVAVATVAMLLASTMALGIVVDPRDEFSSDLYRPIGVSSIEDKLRLYEAHPPPHVLILGTSRAMAVPGDPLADGGPWFNFALHSSTVRDARLVWEKVRSQEAVGHVLLVVDSFQLLSPGDGYPDQIERSRAAGQFAGAPDAGIQVEILAKTVSTDYVLDDLRSLWYAHVAGYPSTTVRFDDDGLRSPGPVDMDPAFDVQGAVERHWDEIVSRIYVLPHQPREAQERELVQLVSDMRAAGAVVSVVLGPFHERTLERLDGNQVFEEFQSALLGAVRSTCAPGVHAYDYTHTSSFGGDPNGFADGYHLSLVNGRRLATAVAEGVGDLCQAN